MDNNERQVCSQAVFDLMTSFNNLPSPSEQEEVLDVIYDAMYGRAYKEVMKDRVVCDLKRKLHDLKDGMTLLNMKNEDLKDRYDRLEEKHLR